VSGGPEREVEWTVLTCDYNGWNDAPEDEREALEAYEAAAEKARSPSAWARVRRRLFNT
jgi:hypothetical protein